jgi:hypothetical protein
MTAPSGDDARNQPPILRRKNHRAPSLFVPEALLREARRQKNIAGGSVPDVCLLDPDGDMVRYVIATKCAVRSRHGRAIIPTSTSSNTRVWRLA